MQRAPLSGSQSSPTLMDQSAAPPRVRRRLRFGSLLSRRFSHLFSPRRDASKDPSSSRRASSPAVSVTQAEPSTPSLPHLHHSQPPSSHNVRSEPSHRLRSLLAAARSAAENDDDSARSGDRSLTGSSRKSIPLSPLTGTSPSDSTVGSATPWDRKDDQSSSPVSSPPSARAVRFEADRIKPSDHLLSQTHQTNSPSSPAADPGPNTTPPVTFSQDDSQIQSPTLTPQSPELQYAAARTVVDSDTLNVETRPSLVSSSDSDSDQSFPSAQNEISSPNVKDPTPTSMSQPHSYKQRSGLRRSPLRPPSHSRAPKSIGVPTALRFDDVDPQETRSVHASSSNAKPPLPPPKASQRQRPKVTLLQPHTTIPERRDDAPPSVLETAAPLDNSPTEDYASISERGERVATAFERLGKQTDEYPETPSELAGGLSPKEVIIPLIIEAMRQHRNDPKVADRALTILRRLTVSENCRRCIGDNGGIEAVVEIMRAHSLRAGIQTQGCLTLANLAYRNRSNKEAVMKCSGLKVVVGSLSAHPNVEQIQAWGCLAIRNFTNRSDAGEQETSVASGAVEVLLSALERYAGSETVQNNALIALTNIASRSPYGMERLRTAGGIQVLVSSLKYNLHSVKLAEVGMSLTRVVAEDDRNKELFGQAGGIQAMTAVMDTHHGHLAISVKGCAAVRHLAFRRKNREIMGSCGIIRTLVCVMNECTTASPDGVCYFLKALCNVTFDSLASKTYAGRCGAVEATLRIMSDSSYREIGRVVEDACRLLRNLLDGVSQNQRNMMKHRGTVVVLGAARGHGEALAGVAEHSVAIFVNMVTNRGFASQLQEGSGDVSQLARKLRKAHEGNPRVETQVSNLVQALERDVRSVASVGSTELRDWRTKSSMERALRPVRSLHRGRHGDDQGTRLQRLRSMPLPLVRNRS
ncbi:Armadillo-like helical domain containing protein [Gracilaria domingensis]|nr:Armadillo-like helical domain containing protein [Gracilaria domingensis]